MSYTDEEVTERKPGPQRVERFEYECPACRGSSADCVIWADGHQNFSCWSCDAAGLKSGDYARALAAELGCTAVELIEDPAHHLRLLATRTSAINAEPEPLPDEGRVRAWQEALNEPTRLAAAARRYLRVERGLTRRTVKQHRLSWDAEAIVIPVYEDGELANVRRRYLTRDALSRYGTKIRGLRGHGVHLYPSPPVGDFIVCEGEFDALLMRQHGFPAVTSTAGTHWKEDDWDRLVLGRRIAVIYDSGVLVAARARAKSFNAAGAKEAWPVDLGLDDGEDLTDWFVKYGRSADRLRRLIRKARP